MGADLLQRPAGVRLALQHRVPLHRPELEHLEATAVTPDPRLPVEHRRSHRELDGKRHQREKRKRYQQHDRRHEAVDRVLDRELPALRVAGVDRDQRHAAQMLHGHATATDLEQPRHHRHRHSQLPAAPGQSEEDVMGSGREGHDHVLDVMLGDDAIEVPARAQHRQARRRRADVEGILVEEADRPQPELRALQQSPRHDVGHPAGADDQRVPHSVSLAAGSQVRHVKNGPSGCQPGGGKEPVVDGPARVRLVAQQDARGDQHHRGRRGGHRQRRQAVEHLQPQPWPVKPSHAQDANDQDRKRKRVPGGSRWRGRRAQDEPEGERGERERDDVDEHLGRHPGGQALMAGSPSFLRPRRRLLESKRSLGGLHPHHSHALSARGRRIVSERPRRGPRGRRQDAERPCTGSTGSTEDAAWRFRELAGGDGEVVLAVDV